MRINKYLAQATGMSRRAADIAIEEKRVKINGGLASPGQIVEANDKVTLDDKLLTLDASTQTILLNKPVGYVCSRDGQGSKTIYDLLPEELHHLKPVGRLDKDSSGLILLTNDGDLAHKLTHPSFEKTKVYEVAIDQPLKQQDFKVITKTGVDIGDSKLSRLQLQQLATSKQKLGVTKPVSNSYFLVTISEGRNRQIRRTFEALGYKVQKLHRTQFGPYSIGSLLHGDYQKVRKVEE